MKTRESSGANSSRSTWARLSAIARPERGRLGLGVVFLALSSVTTLLFPQLMRWLIDEVLQPKKSELLLPAALGLFAAFSLLGVFGSVRYYLFSLSGERIVLKLRAELLRRLLLQDVAFFDANRTGDLLSRLSSDCTTLQNTVSVNVSQGLRNISQVVGGFGFMFYTSWQLSSLMLLLMLPVAGVTAVFGRRIRGFAKGFQNTLAASGIVAEEALSGVRTVKSFGREAAESERYQEALTAALMMVKQRIQAIAVFMTIAMMIGLGSICFVLWYGGREVILGQMSIGDMTQFLLYLMLVAIGAGSLGSLWGDLMAGIGASKRVFEIIEREPEVDQGGRELAALQGRLELRDVHFSYPARPDAQVLGGVSLEVKPGQTIALVGASGGGKSTIASLILRFYEPTAGLILLDGVPLRELKQAFVRRQIGLVAQEPVLISATIAANIRYGRPEASDSEVQEAAAAANALAFIKGFPDGFQTQVGDKGLQLSGGQKQRIAIARALLKDPRILLLDEATSSLDSASEALVQEALQRLMQGRTTIVIAHRLTTVKAADQIYVIGQGRVLEQGRHDDLAKRADGAYRKLLEKQFSSDQSLGV